jgi:DNA repair protein RecO (recombination protein O)
MSQILDTEGVIIRTVKYSETSIIMDIFTLDHGLKSCIISGVRSPKSKAKSSLFQVMNFMNFSFYKKENDQLHRIKEYSYNHLYQNLQIDVLRSSVGIFLIECTRNSIKEKEENIALYDFIKQNFIALDTIEINSLSLFYLHYLIDLSVYLGFYPLDNYSEENKYFDLLNGSFTSNSYDSKHTMDHHSSVLFSRILKNETNLKIVRSEKEKIVDYLMMYYALHVDGFRQIKSLDVLRTLFGD